MTDYTELVKALRDTERVCRDRMDGQVMLDAAAAIEGLQSKLTSLEAVLAQMPDLVETRDGWKLEPKRGQYVHGRELSREYIGDCLVSIDYEDWRCSICGIVFEQWSIPKYNYCPNCGAKMGGTE